MACLAIQNLDSESGSGRAHPYITSAKGLGLEKWQFLLTFSTIFVDVEWLGGSEKVQKYADVI